MIRNTSKGTILTEDHRECTSILSKARGLMFTRRGDFSLVFRFAKEKIVSLHMFFVFYSIDVLFLDNKGIVVDLKTGFRPFTPIYVPQKKAITIIECPEGRIEKSKSTIGDTISIS